MQRYSQHKNQRQQMHLPSPHPQKDKLLDQPAKPEQGNASHQKPPQSSASQLPRKNQIYRPKQQKHVNQPQIQNLHNSPVGRVQLHQLLPPAKQPPKSQVEKSEQQIIATTREEKLPYHPPKVNTSLFRVSVLQSLLHFERLPKERGLGAFLTAPAAAGQTA
ncbi:MAG: hypothetical protein ACRYFX_25145 [Janthinobacterium lividum]